MNILKHALLAMMMLCACTVHAKGSSHGASLGGNKSVYVHGYTKKDGTVVAPYYRSPPGSATHYNAATGTFSFDGLQDSVGNPSAADVVGQRKATALPGTRCEYKAVMTDDEIETCKCVARAGGTK